MRRLRVARPDMGQRQLGRVCVPQLLRCARGAVLFPIFML